MRVWCKGGKASFHVFFTSVSYIFVSILFYAFIASRFILVSLSWVQSLENALGHASEECERQANDGHIYEGKVMNKEEIIEMYLEVSNKLCNGTEWCWSGVDEPLQPAKELEF